MDVGQMEGGMQAGSKEQPCPKQSLALRFQPVHLVAHCQPQADTVSGQIFSTKIGIAQSKECCLDSKHSESHVLQAVTCAEVLQGT